MYFVVNKNEKETAAHLHEILTVIIFYIRIFLYLRVSLFFHW